MELWAPLFTADGSRDTLQNQVTESWPPRSPLSHTHLILHLTVKLVKHVTNATMKPDDKAEFEEPQNAVSGNGRDWKVIVVTPEARKISDLGWQPSDQARADRT